MAFSKNAAFQLSYSEQGVCEAISNLTLMIQLPFHAKLHVFIFQPLFLEKTELYLLFSPPGLSLTFPNGMIKDEPIWQRRARSTDKGTV